MTKHELVAYCGLYCGDCFGYKGKVADLARDLRKELRAAKFDKFAKSVSASVSFFKAFGRYNDCYNQLGLMVKLRCKKACRGGGGSPFCKVRACCERMKFDGCWECSDFESCNKLDFLKQVHGEGHLRNIRKLKKRGKKEFINGKRNW